jgi:CheY-like chemotaxis protein
MGQREDIQQHDPGGAFLRDLRHALNHLYEPEALRHSPLIHAFDLSQANDVAVTLRHLLVEAIEKLRPEEDVPLQSAIWRAYHVMVQRFVEQATQQEVANDLGLSVRQTRRQESAGLKEVARLLLKQHQPTFDHNHLDRAVASIPEGLPAPSLPATSRERELEWSQRSYPREFLPVARLVQSAIETAAPLARMMDVEVTSTLPPAMPPLAVQPVTARQALLGLLALAIRRVPRGRISITGERVATGVMVEIAAYGAPGMRAAEASDEENIDFIKALIASSGGHLEIVPPTADGRALLARITLQGEEQLTVLAIDDNPDSLQLLERYVTDTRYRIVSVQEPHKALAVAEELVPDIILLDVMMPDMDGWELMGQLREHPKIGHIPLIVCTILPQEQLALALGATAFLRKPINRKEFLTLLNRQLDLLRR